jgi:hypothetical protein
VAEGLTGEEPVVTVTMPREEWRRRNEAAGIGRILKPAA